MFRRARSVANMAPELLREHVRGTRPVPLHLTGLISGWPALQRWTIANGLKDMRQAVGEDRNVEVELAKKARGYLHPDWQRVHMPFGIFLDAFILGLVPSAGPSSSLPAAYLAQSDLLDLAPNLAAAVPPLPHFYQGREESLYRRTVWIGPEQSFTPLHKDPYINIYSQIIGEKTFHILPPEAAQHLSPSNLPRHTNTSRIPLPISRIFGSPGSSDPSVTDDLADLPRDTIETCRNQLEKAFSADGACVVTVEAGESVLVPEGWWHSAEGGDSPGVGVGAWFR
ncbi:hypothetical protein IAU60_003963 [Kwoniella sp. DSM 27419]